MSTRKKRNPGAATTGARKNTSADTRKYNANPPRLNIWFPFYVGDYMRETHGLTHAEKGAFVELLCGYSNRQGPLPDDDIQLARLAGMSPKKWQKIRDSISPIFTISDGLWIWPRLEAQITRSLEIRQKRQQAGRCGGLKSWGIRQANAEANAENDLKQVLNKSKSDKPPYVNKNYRGGVDGVEVAAANLAEAVSRGVVK
jgi:uncharacterized protein YdaU (DUF1376 family)